MTRWTKLFLFCLGIFIAAAFCMKWIEKDIVVNGRLVSILDLELFWPADKIREAFTNADSLTKTVLGYHLYFDFIFMSGCFPGIAALCMMSREKTKSRLLKIILLALAFLQVIAWAFDIIENSYLLKWLKDPVIGAEFGVYHAVVYSKWVIALVGVLLAGGVFVTVFFKRIFSKQKSSF